MTKPQADLLSGTADVEGESLVALLADEAEYWKARAEALDHIVDELKAEIDSVHRRADITEAWRKGLAEAMLDGTGFTEAGPPVRAMALILAGSLAVWAFLGLLAFVLYSFFTA
jgi:hypothetical protein